jgi:hypothetical protein
MSALRVLAVLLAAVAVGCMIAAIAGMVTQRQTPLPPRAGPGQSGTERRIRST